MKNEKIKLVIDTKFILYKLLYQDRTIADYAKYITEKFARIKMRNLSFDEVIFLMDTKPTEKLKIFPDYKQHRKENKKKYLSEKDQERFDRLIDIYDEYGEDYFSNYGTVLKAEGYEADDLAKYVVDNLKKDETAILLSSDRDWSFLVKKDQVKMFHLDKNLFVTEENFEEVYKFSKKLLQMSKSFTGMPKENVSGIKKLGDKTFVEIYNEANGDLEKVIDIITEWIDLGKDNISMPTDSSIRELYELNKVLLGFLPISENKIIRTKKKSIFDLTKINKKYMPLLSGFVNVNYDIQNMFKLKRI